MDDAELEEWFTQERERLETTYTTGAEARKNPEKLRATFDDGFRKLVHKYQERQASIYAQERRRMALQKPITRLREHINLTRRSVHDWWTLRVQQVRAWLFHQKVRRAMKRLH